MGKDCHLRDLDAMEICERTVRPAVSVPSCAGARGWTTAFFLPRRRFVVSAEFGAVKRVSEQHCDHARWMNVRKACCAVSRQSPSSMPRSVKSARAVASLSKRWFVNSIRYIALYLFERRHGSFTALICFDSVMEEQSPFGAPKAQMRSM